jgi:hypothetical protein
MQEIRNTKWETNPTTKPASLPAENYWWETFSGYSAPGSNEKPEKVPSHDTKQKWQHPANIVHNEQSATKKTRFLNQTLPGVDL